MSNYESFGDGLMQGFSFVEGIRAARDNRAIRAREMAIREEEAARATERHQWEAENHAEAVRQADEARQNQAMTRSATSLRALLQKYGSMDKIPDEAKAPFMTGVLEGYGDRSTRVDRIHRDGSGNAVLEVSGTRPDGTKFSGKPLSRQGGTDDDPIVFEPGDVDDQILTSLAPYDDEIGKYLEKRYTERETADAYKTALGISGDVSSNSVSSDMSGGPVPTGAASPPRGITPAITAPPAANTPPIAAPAVAQPAPPTSQPSLQDQQAASDAALAGQRPNPLKAIAGIDNAIGASQQKMKDAVTRQRWDLVLNVNDPTNADVRANPNKYVAEYARDRDKLGSNERAQLDAHFRPSMEAARKEAQQEIDALTSRDRTGQLAPYLGAPPGARAGRMESDRRDAQISRAKQRLAQIDSTMRSMDDQRRVTVELGIDGQQKTGDRLAQAVGPTLKAAAEQPSSDPSPGRLQAATQLVRNAQGKRRISAAQVDAVALLVSRKILDPEEGERVLAGGSIAKPEFMNWNPSQALVRIGPDGTPRIAYAPDPRYVAGNAAATKAAESAREKLNGAGKAYVTRLSNDYEQAQGKFGKGTAGQMESGFYNFLATMPGAIHESLGMDVLGDTGRIDFSKLHEGQIGTLWDGYVKAMNAKTAIEQQGAFSEIWGAITGKQQPSTNPIDYIDRPAALAAGDAPSWTTRAEVASLASEYGVSEDEVVAALEAQGIELIE